MPKLTAAVVRERAKKMGFELTSCKDSPNYRPNIGVNWRMDTQLPSGGKCFVGCYRTLAEVSAHLDQTAALQNLWPETN